MVHGCNILSRYVLALKRPIDKYDHLMDTMKSCRRDFKLIGNGKKIVIFDGWWLGKARGQVLSDVTHNFDDFADMRDFDSPRGSFKHCTWSDQLGKKGGDVQGWLDLYFYSTRKFDMHEDLAKFDESEWQNAKVAFAAGKGSHAVKNGRSKFKFLIEAARWTHMHKNQEYLAKVKELEAAATSVLLTAAEQSMIDSVKSSPHLHDNIEQEGVELYIQDY